MRDRLLQEEAARNERDGEPDSKPVDGVGFVVAVISGP